MPWAARLKNLFRPNRLDREVDEELRFHLEARVRDNLAAGMTPTEARQDAIRRFGGQLLTKDKTRDADILVWLDTLGQDIRYAFRNLRKNAGVTAAAALSLALGIGANTAIFSALHAIVLRPLPYKDPARLARLWLDNRRLSLHVCPRLCACGLGQRLACEVFVEQRQRKQDNPAAQRQPAQPRVHEEYGGEK